MSEELRKEQRPVQPDQIDDCTIVSKESEYSISEDNKRAVRLQSIDGAASTGVAKMPRNLVGQMECGRKEVQKCIATGYGRDLFSELDTNMQEDILDVYKETPDTRERIYIGIGLDDDKDWNIIDTIVALLHKKSQTNRQDASDYYMGNGTREQQQLITIGKNDYSTPVIVISKGEWIKEFTLAKDPSSADKRKALEALDKYSKRHYYMKYTEFYDEEITTKKGKATTRRCKREVEGYRALYAVSKISNDKQQLDKDGNPVFDDAGNVVMEKHPESLVITLDPIFRRQIESHYILKPIDLRRKLMEAYRDITNTKNRMPDSLLPFIYQLLDAQHYQGSKTIPERTYRVRQNTITNTGADGKDEVTLGLYDIINSKAVKARKIGDVAKQLETYIAVAKRIGLLQRYWTEPSSNTGDTNHYFQVVDADTWKALNN